MRYDGIGRAAPPYPNAPNMHYPLVDTMIEKVKPVFIGQLYGQRLLADFTSGVPQDDALTSKAEQLFDYLLKQQTNFERTAYTSIDHMLMYGRGPMKVYWDADNKRIQFVPVRPIHIIVPSWTEELGEADWLVHVIHMSEAAYRRKKKYNQDEAFIKRIKGKGDRDGSTGEHEDEIKLRSGITCGQDDRQIVLWEAYRRSGETIQIETASPMLPDEQMREDFPMPYRHGEMPFGDLRYELADPDYYSPRGMTEVLSQRELALCKLWNHKLQFLDYAGQPVFKNAGGGVLPSNWKNEPGKILPQGIEPVDAKNAPLDFKEEMEMERALAEDRVQVPDLSAGQHLAGNRGSNGDITATQIQAITGQSNTANDTRSRIFRMQLAGIFGQAWELMNQFIFPQGAVTLEDHSEVPQEALHAKYRVMPSGSPDSANRESRQARGIAFYQLLQGNPYIKQDELTTWTLEQGDATMVDRLVQEPMDAQQDQQEQQANELVLMENHFTPRVKPADDDKVHVSTMAEWGEWQIHTGNPVSPEMAGRVLAHLGQHEQQMDQKKDKEGLALLQKLQPYVQILQSLAAQGQMQMQGGMPGQPQLGAPPPQQAPRGPIAAPPAALGVPSASLAL